MEKRHLFMLANVRGLCSLESTTIPVPRLVAGLEKRLRLLRVLKY